MSYVQHDLHQHNKGGDEDDDDPQVDFCNLSTRSLQRPSDHYIPPPRRSHLASRILRDPWTTALTHFSKVTNYVLNPYDDDSPYEIFNSLREPLNHHKKREKEEEKRRNVEPISLPPPALPTIECSVPQQRLPLLTEEEYNEKFASAGKKELLERIFRGGIASHTLRRKLWPIVLGLSEKAEDFDWTKLKTLYEHYSNQWNNILPDQELRFTAYRERKSLIDRDVIRCDRTHSFFADSTGNLEKLRQLLMTYIMYDFDTGYVQGMTDLAAPLLYVWEGDVTKAFWCFVQIMNLFKRNFEMSQNSISNQLKTLLRLIRITDPVFAQYLCNNESDNCYFAFRWIICLFKREFMKNKADDYDDCLIVWETIWSLHSLSQLDETIKPITNELSRDCLTPSNESIISNQDPRHNNSHQQQKPQQLSPQPFLSSSPAKLTPPPPTPTSQTPLALSPPARELIFTTLNDVAHYSKQADKLSTGWSGSGSDSKASQEDLNHCRSARSHRDGADGDDIETYSLNQEALSTGSEYNLHYHQRLENVELFCLCICLAIIRRERDIILARKYEASDILKHFNTLQLNDCLNSILLHATSIWHWLKYDGGEKSLYSDDERPINTSVEDFDLLNDEDCQALNALSV